MNLGNIYPEDGTQADTLDFATGVSFDGGEPGRQRRNLPPDYLESLKNLPERMRRRFYDGSSPRRLDNALWRRAWIKRGQPG